MIEEVALPYLNLKASQDNAFPNLNNYSYSKKAEFIYLLLSSQMLTIPTFSGSFVFEPYRLLITSIIRSCQRTWLAFEITGQSVPCSLALQATTFLWRHLCNAFIHLWRNGLSISSFRSASALAGCNGRKLTSRSKPGRGILNE